MPIRCSTSRATPIQTSHIRSQLRYRPIPRTQWNYSRPRDRFLIQVSRAGQRGTPRRVNIGQNQVRTDRIAPFPTRSGETLMTRVIAVLAAFGAMLISTSASAQLELAKQKNCLACHAVDKKLVGPAYKDVAKKYESDKDAAPRLAKKVRRAESACGAKSRCRPTRRSMRPSRCNWSNGSFRLSKRRRPNRRGAPGRPAPF